MTLHTNRITRVFEIIHGNELVVSAALIFNLPYTQIKSIMLLYVYVICIPYNLVIRKSFLIECWHHASMWAK